MKYVDNVENKDENSDVISMWEPLKLNIDESYKYVPSGIIFNLFSNILYYLIAFPILKVLTKIVYDLKIEGKENIKNLKGGAISVSNHVLFLDCAMIGLAFGFKKRVYYTTREGSFKIPFVRKLIKLLRAIPIPSGIKNKERFVKAINNLLQDGKVVHFYPESALWPYCSKLRNFKTGPFDFAIKNNSQVVPIVFKFRKPKGIRKIFKKKKDVTLIILPSIKGDMLSEEVNNKMLAIKLKENVYEEMKKVINRDNK